MHLDVFAHDSLDLLIDDPKLVPLPLQFADADDIVFLALRQIADGNYNPT